MSRSLVPDLADLGMLAINTRVGSSFRCIFGCDEGEELLGFGDAPQDIPAYRDYSLVFAHSRSGHGRGDDQVLFQGAAHGLNACRHVDRGPDHREIEAILSADIAEHQVAKVKREAEFGKNQAFCPATVVIIYLFFTFRGVNMVV